QGVDPAAAIEDEETRPTATEEAGRPYIYWESKETKAIMVGQKRLRFGTPEQAAVNEKLPRRSPGLTNFLTNEQRQEKEWESGLRDFLNELDRWHRDHEELETDHFHQLVMTYRHLHSLAPPGDLRDLILGRLISALKSSPVETLSPPEWFVEL